MSHDRWYATGAGDFELTIHVTAEWEGFGETKQEAIRNGWQRLIETLSRRDFPSEFITKVLLVRGLDRRIEEAVQVDPLVCEVCEKEITNPTGEELFEERHSACLTG